MRWVPTLIWREGLVGSVFLMLVRSRLKSAPVTFMRPSSRSSFTPISLFSVISGSAPVVLAASAKVSAEGWNDLLYDT